MLFRRNVAEIGVVHRPTEGDVSVAFHQSGHQRPASGLDDYGAICRKPAGRTCDGLDSGALDKYVAGKGRRTAAVPHIGTAEKNWLHHICLVSNLTTHPADPPRMRRCGLQKTIPPEPSLLGSSRAGNFFIHRFPRGTYFIRLPRFRNPKKCAQSVRDGYLMLGDPARHADYMPYLGMRI